MKNLPPSPHSLASAPLLARVLAGVPDDQPLYLVGGWVRDQLLNRLTYDLDFTLPGDALRVARRVADALGGAYYPLDDRHGTGRVLWTLADGQKLVLDFAALRGPDLESDLRKRDFTVNAMAVDARQPQTLIDPLGGVADLRAGRLRACSPEAFRDDPLRVLRGVRLAAALQFQLLPETSRAMRAASGRLAQVSAERQRDELFRILNGPRPHAAIGVLEHLSALAVVLPELPPLQGLDQPPPHIGDAWSHTLRTLDKLEVLLDILGPTHDPEKAADLSLSMAVLRLGRYRQPLDDHLGQPVNTGRPLRPLLFLAGLYHDVAKPQTRQETPDGRVRFLDHPSIGADLADQRARSLRLSNPERRRLVTIVRHHMRPLLLAQAAKGPTRRAVYRFFRDTGPAGVDICLLSMADVLATYGAALPTEVWARHLDVVRILLEAWWEQHEQRVAPDALVDGHDLMDALGLTTGPMLGRLIDHLREAQASGEIENRAQALDLARRWLSQNEPD